MTRHIADVVGTVMRKSDQVRDYRQGESGFASLRAVAWFSAIALSLSVLGAPLLQDAADQYAAYRGGGLDRTVTGSVGGGRQYIIRQSVLSPNPHFICKNGSGKCEPSSN